MAAARLATGIRLRTLVLASAAASVVFSQNVSAASLNGSRGSLRRQNAIARDHNYTYLRSASQVSRFVSGGYLVPLDGNRNYELVNVSFPYARPELRTFIDRLSGQYRSACGEKLIVTSLTRPYSAQPDNASPLSVHPTGMAVDLRLSNQRGCRSWLERVLLSLESKGVLEATRERHPPHYHVAVYPKQYSTYVNQLGKDRGQIHVVRSGETLWKIAKAYGTTVSTITVANGLAGSALRPGQRLSIPNYQIEASSPVIGPKAIDGSP